MGGYMLIYLNNICNTELVLNSYTNPSTLIITGLLVFLFLFSFSNMIIKGFFSKLFIFFGKNSLYFLFFNFLSNRIINRLLFYVFDMKDEKLLQTLAIIDGKAYRCVIYFLGTVLLTSIFILLKKYISYIWEKKNVR